MTTMFIPNLRFSTGMALGELAQFRKEEFCKPQVGGSIPLASSTLSADDSTAFELTDPLHFTHH